MKYPITDLYVAETIKRIAALASGAAEQERQRTERADGNPNSAAASMTQEGDAPSASPAARDAAMVERAQIMAGKRAGTGKKE